MKDSEISVEKANMLGRFEIEKDVILMLLKSIKVDREGLFCSFSSHRQVPR